MADELDKLERHKRSYWGYTSGNERYVIPQAYWTHNILNLSYLGANAGGVIYGDKMHYTVAFMGIISQDIGDGLPNALVCMLLHYNKRRPPRIMLNRIR